MTHNLAWFRWAERRKTRQEREDTARGWLGVAVNEVGEISTEAAHSFLGGYRFNILVNLGREDTWIKNRVESGPLKFHRIEDVVSCFGIEDSEIPAGEIESYPRGTPEAIKAGMAEFSSWLNTYSLNRRQS